MEYVCLSFLCLLLSLVCHSQKLPGCTVENVHYPVGRHFTVGCAAFCQCANREGDITCVSMCPPVFYPPECLLVKPMGECCNTGDCNLNDTCKHFDAVVPNLHTTVIPWQVKISVGQHGDRNCSATILSKRKLLTSSECISNLEPISFVSKKQNFNWTAVSVLKKAGFPYSLIKLANPIDYLTTVHEINFPWPRYCSDDDCALWIASVAYDANSRPKFIQAKKALPSKCGLTETSQLACLEIGKYDEPCENLDQASVLVKKGQFYYYLVGVVAGGPSEKIAGTDCDATQPSYRKYVNLCHKTNGVAETEWLQSFMEN